jgi:hypothetical protein
MAQRYKIARYLGETIFIVSLCISPAAFAAFDVYAKGGAIYKADLAGDRLMLLGRDGKKTPAPDGFYMTAEGKKYKVEKGIAALVVPKKKEPTPAEPTVAENKKPNNEPKKNTDNKSANKQSSGKLSMNDSKKPSPQPADPTAKNKDDAPNKTK